MYVTVVEVMPQILPVEDAEIAALARKRFEKQGIKVLTGAKVTALGDEYAGLFGRHEGLVGAVQAAADATGEAVWRLPLHPNYAEDLKSDITDIKHGTEGVPPGAGHGAHFIGFFVDPATPWAHIDIAGNEMSDSAKPLTPKGATGFGVRLLDALARAWKRLSEVPFSTWMVEAAALPAAGEGVDEWHPTFSLNPGTAGCSACGGTTGKPSTQHTGPCPTQWPRNWRSRSLDACSKDSPCRTMSPATGCSSLGSKPITVVAMTDLPEPDSPTTHRVWPGRMSSDTSVMAFARSPPAGKATDRPRMDRTG